MLHSAWVRWGALLGAILFLLLLSLSTEPPQAAIGAPGFAPTSIVDDQSPNNISAAIMVGQVATPGAAGTPGVYVPLAASSSGQLSGGSFPYSANTAIPVQGRIGASTPVTGVNPVLIGVQDYNSNLQPLHVSVPATGDNAGDARLQTGALVQGQSSTGSTLVNILAEPTTGSLHVAPYVINGSGSVDQVQGGRFLTTPVATATGFQNVLAGGVTRLTPVTMTNAQVANLSLDSNGNLSVAQGVALPAGEAHLGAVGGNTLRPSSNPVLTVASSYVTGDYVGTSATPWSWTACRTSGGTGQLQSVTLVDKASQSVSAELWLFDRSVTVPNDSAAWTITDADAQFLLGVVPINTYYASGANSVASVTGIGLTLGCNGSTSVFGALVVRGAPTWASGDVTIGLGVLSD